MTESRKGWTRLKRSWTNKEFDFWRPFDAEQLSVELNMKPEKWQLLRKYHCINILYILLHVTFFRWMKLHSCSTVFDMETLKYFSLLSITQDDCKSPCLMDMKVHCHTSYLNWTLAIYGACRSTHERAAAQLTKHTGIISQSKNSTDWYGQLYGLKIFTHIHTSVQSSELWIKISYFFFQTNLFSPNLQHMVWAFH